MGQKKKDYLVDLSKSTDVAISGIFFGGDPKIRYHSTYKSRGHNRPKTIPAAFTVDKTSEKYRFRLN